MSVILVVKSATQTVEDFNLDCELSWTIGQVKDQIAELYPTKPKRENQKLIYGGKLLPDHLSLKSVLNHSQERHIVHLVYPAPEKTISTESKEVTSPQSFPVPQANPTFTPWNQPILNQSLSGMPAVNMTSFGTGDAFQQYVAMQQMYAQFMTQYLSQYNGGVPPVIPHGPVISAPPVPTPQVPNQQQNVAPNVPPRPADEEVHDFLDYVYIFSRAMLLFAILFYYSSLQRVLIVVSMFLFISFYVKLNRQNQQEQQRQANESQRNETPPVTQPLPNADIQVSGNEEEIASPPTDSLSQQAEGRSIASMISVTVSLISAFFSSLIPSDPVPVNVN